MIDTHNAESRDPTRPENNGSCFTASSTRPAGSYVFRSSHVDYVRADLEYQDTPGPTFLSYTPNGRRLITAGSNDSIRIYTTGSVGEPANIDDCQESNTAVVASNDFFITGSEDGTVCMYSLQTKSLDKILVRCTLPVRDVVLSPDGQWAAVASDELVVKVVNTEDMNRVLYLREQAKPVKHLSFHPNGSYIAVSCADGKVYIYSLSKEEPELVKKVDGLIRALETDVEASSKVVWHPDGRAFAAPTNTRGMLAVERDCNQTLM
ncbi:MAG: hypothetical protein M1819_005171 [Sarea resinae]|nr:MAG: hypothetical protein M1819_005171 [Sarea resinae]